VAAPTPARIRAAANQNLRVMDIVETSSKASSPSIAPLTRSG
jgi:hypothetical protein